MFLNLPKLLPPTLLKDMSLAPAIDISAHSRHKRQSPPALSFFASPGLILVSARVPLSSPARQPNCARTSQNEATARTAPSAPSTTPVGSPSVTLHDEKPNADSKMIRSPALPAPPTPTTASTLDLDPFNPTNDDPISPIYPSKRVPPRRSKWPSSPLSYSKFGQADDGDGYGEWRDQRGEFDVRVVGEDTVGGSRRMGSSYRSEYCPC